MNRKINLEYAYDVARSVLSMSATMFSRRLVHRAIQLKVPTRLSSSSANSSTPVPASPSSIANQAPNYPTTWSTSQKPRPVALSGPRFEQTHLELQPNPLSAMGLIESEPIRAVHGRKAVCDGGGGPLGHPKIFINLDKPGPRPCGYCGLRFEQAPHDH